MRAQLTDITVRSLKPEPGKQLKVWDIKTPGFGVRVNGRTKSWIVMFGRKRQLKVLGQFPATTLSEARKKALVILGSSKAEETSVGFSEALDAFYEIHVPTLKARTQKEIKRTLNRHFRPELKGKRLGDITHRNIAAITDQLIETPSEAWHAFKDARTFFNWCVPRYIPHSPCEGLKPPSRYTPRKQLLSDLEIKAVWSALQKIDYPFSQIVKLLILTGCRYGEITSLRRSFINENDKTITLPETKNRDAHTFPYGGLVAEVLGAVPHFTGTNLLFPGRDDQRPWNGAGKAKWQLDKICKIEPWQLLDCRRTFGTKLAELKVLPHIVERLLNHKLGTLSNQTGGAITAVAEVYNRYMYLDEMRSAIQAWEERIMPLVIGP